MKIKTILLLFITALILASKALAWDGPPPLIGGGLVNLSRPTSYTNGYVGGDPTGQSPFAARARANAVVSENSIDTYQINFRGEVFQIPAGIPLAGQGINAPTNLYSLDIGGSYRHNVDSNHDWGFTLSGGSDSDIPFNTLNEVDYSVTGTYHWQRDPLHAWVFLLNYSKTRSFWPGVPLPGAGYFVVSLEDHTQIFYGLPFFFGWEFKPQWKLTATYFLLTSVNIELSRRLSESLRLYTNFQWLSQTWLRANRLDSNNHLIFDSKKLVAGIAWGLGDRWNFNFLGGFSFDQRIAEAYSITSQNIVYGYFPASLVAQLEGAYKF